MYMYIVYIFDFTKIIQSIDKYAKYITFNNKHLINSLHQHDRAAHTC